MIQPAIRPFPDSRIKIAIVVVALCGAVLSIAASRANSLTFDEPFMISAGARGIETGDYSMGWDQPPGMMYLFGGAVHVYDALSRSAGGRGIAFPSDSGTYELSPELAAQMPRSLGVTTTAPRWGLYNRYDYAREFFHRVGNDPQRVALVGRIVTVFIGLLLALGVAGFAWRRAGPLAALFAVSVFAFFPDVLAHGAIAHNDLALAAGFFIAIITVDALVRSPGPRTALGAGVAVGLALCIKFSALALGPVALLIGAAELFARRQERDWIRRASVWCGVAVLVSYAVLVVAYRGDFALVSFREGTAEQLGHSAGGHGVPSLLLGRISPDGFWYFYPVALFLKSTIALHALLLAAAAGWFIRGKQRIRVPSSPWRPLIVGGVFYLAVLMQSSLNIGVRYALPLLPIIAVLVGVGLSHLWLARGRLLRAAVIALLIANAALSARHYPWYLSYITESIGSESRYRALSDSSYDWGQGLLALHDFMAEENIPGVYLSYFGSALPEGYGVQYFPLPSWLSLPAHPEPPQRYGWVVISATHLNGLYQAGDPFADFRRRTPDRVIGRSFFAYQIR